MANTQEIIDITERYCAHNYKPLPVVLSRAEGIWVWDPEGTRYLDFLSAYSAVNQGHRHPAIMAALAEQAGRITLTSRAFHSDQLGPFLKELVELCGMEMALPMNTGAEAVETAIKTARKWGYTKQGVRENKAKIIVCNENFHGRTTTIISFSSDPLYKENFGPFTPGFELIPYGDIGALAGAVDEDTVAFLVEPIQGEAGVVVPPEGYLREARRICTENNVLLMLDEIQTGLGRTGRMFAYEYEGIRPDVLIVGKALGGGVIPISAVVSSEEILGVFRPGEHGSTFGGNPLACAVARAAMRVLVEDRLAERSFELGQYFMERLVEICGDKAAEVRGKGLLIGVQLKPGGETARTICERLKEEGLLCKETHEHTVRFAPPLVIEREEIDWALERIARVFK